MLNVFGIADDILVIGYDINGADHDEAVYKVLKQCQDINLKPNKENFHFRCTSIPFFGEVVSRQGIQPDPQKVRAQTEMPAPQNKKELQALLGVINYLNKFSPGTSELCKLLRKLTSSKTTWTWNESYQQLLDKAKSLIKGEMCMKFYDDTKLLYLEADASGFSLGAALLQLRDNTNCLKNTAPDNTICCPIVFASKSLTGAEQRYSNIKCEALGILHGLEKSHHYCFGREVLVITDHKPLVSIFKNDIATLSQRIQCILLKIYPYRVQVLYKPGPDIFIADWLSRHNHGEGKDQMIKGMELWVDIIQTTTDMPECLSVTDLQQASSQDSHIQKLKHFIITGLPDSKDEVSEKLKPYWSYRDELAVINGMVLKGRHIIIPNILKQQVLDQLHINHIGIEKVKLLAHECIYWHSINTDIEKYIKQCTTCLEFQQTQPKEKIIHHEVPLRPWEAVGADVFHFNNINYLYVVDYNNKFPIVWKLQGLSAEHLINAVSAIFTEYGISHKLMS